MNRSLPNITLLLIVAFSLNLATAYSQSSPAVYCVNCGTETTQLLSKLTMAKQLTTQAQQLQTQISQYQNMVMNSKTLPTQLWNNAMRDFQQLNNLMQQSKSLAYSAQNIGSQFSSRYGSYGTYLNQNMNHSAWQNKYAQWSQQNSDNALYTLKGLGLQANQMVNDQATLQRIQTMASSSTGQMQALQVANQMAAQNVDQIMKLRQLIMLQAQMQANQLAQIQDKQAAEQAARENYFKVHNIQLRTGKGF